MSRLLFLDTSIFSANIGDQIIVENIRRQMAPILERSFVLSAPTQISTLDYRMLLSRNFAQWAAKSCDYSLVCGTNLLVAKRRVFPFSLSASWKVGFPSALLLNNCILVGCGLNSHDTKPNFLSKTLYKRLLTDRFMHSVRDSQAHEFLNNIGIKSINTGCPTTWSLTESHCRQIPSQKSKNVVFTLTDYNQHPVSDLLMINTLIKNYENIYFFPQGLNDNEYFNSLNFGNTRIQAIYPNLMAYKKLLEEQDIDYVGTRLHGGVLAMQYKRRSIIISIDNRTSAMGNDIGLNTILRDKIESLDEVINSNIPTKININYAGISEWLHQFDYISEISQNAYFANKNISSS